MPRPNSIGHIDQMNVEAVIIEAMLREHAGTIPDAQLVEEVGLALAIHRRQG